MRTIRYACTLLILTAATLFALSPAALAHPAPPPDDQAGAATGSLPVPTSDPTVVVTHHGSPVWTFVVVALVAIAVTLAAQTLLARTRPGLRRRPARA